MAYSNYSIDYYNAQTTTTVTTAAMTAAMPLVLFRLFEALIWMSVTVVPVGAICSLTCDLLIISLMPRTKGVSRKASLAYTSIAFSDMVPVILDYLLRAFPTAATVIGVPLWTFERFNSATCKAGRYLEFTWQGISNMLVAAFNIERCIAVASPFMARKFTFRRSVLMIAIIVACYNAIQGGEIYINDLKGIAYGLNPYCSVQPVEYSGMLHTFTMVITYILPIVIIVFSNCIIYIILERRDKRIQDISQKKSSSASAKIMVIISLMHVLFFLPTGVLYAASTTIAAGLTSTILRYSSNYPIFLGSFTSTTNFIVYIVNIRAFRQVFLCKSSS